jgi:hypothetical protein
MGSIMSAIVIASVHSRKMFGGYFFGRPIWFESKTQPIRYGIALLLPIGVAAFCWAKALWLLLGILIPG